jgi:hypothetical protein
VPIRASKPPPAKARMVQQIPQHTCSIYAAEIDRFDRTSLTSKLSFSYFNGF